MTLTQAQVKALGLIERASVSILSIGYRGHTITCYFANGGEVVVQAVTARALRRRGLIDWTLDGDRWLVKVTK